MSLKSNDIAKLLQAEVIGEFPDDFPIDVVTDSRKTFMNKDAIFVAIKGGNFNGNDYLNEAYNKGLRHFLISEPQKLPEGANALVVDNVLKALQVIAKAHRDQFDLAVIGITGSNGKTIVKDWLAELCAQNFSVYKSPKSYNSQLGVALSLLGIRKHHNIAIIEAGISRVGEMESLENMIQPSFGILTHIGPAHQEGFRDKSELLEEKLSLFKHCKTLLVQSIEQTKATFFQSFSKKVLVSEEIKENNNEEHNIASTNKKTAFIAALELGIPRDVALEKLNSLQPLNMRLEQLNGINNCEIINDGYSLDMDSLEIALQFMERQNVNLSRTVVLSDFATTPTKDGDYQKIAELFGEFAIKRVVLIGENIGKQMELFRHFNTEHFNSTTAFIENFDPAQWDKENILIKGARKFELEKIASLLQEKVHSTHVEINLNILSENIDFFRSKTGSNVKLMAMVKASSYGGGTHQIANLLEYKNIDYLGVAYPDEGVELRKAGLSIPIMVLNTDLNSISTCIQHKLEPVIYSLSFLNSVIEKIGDAKLNIHLEVDTGMKRLGFDKKDIGLAKKIIEKANSINVVSIFSHLVGADEAKFDAFTLEQIEHFDKSASIMEEDTLKHLCNTAGILRFPQAHYDMVRLGIGMYGIDPTSENAPIQCALSLKTIISQIKTVESGESIGYSRNAVAKHKMRLGILPIGYADGVRRSLGNGNIAFYCNDQEAPTVGNICMDMCMVDLTNVTCKEGDEVIVFSNNVQLEKVAKAMDTISYEVLTGISDRVKRIFTEE